MIEHDVDAVDTEDTVDGLQNQMAPSSRTLCPHPLNIANQAMQQDRSVEYARGWRQ